MWRVGCSNHRDHVNGKEIVRAGYNLIASDYLAARRLEVDAEEFQLLPDLIRRLPRRAKVLDAGCGAGVPLTQTLDANFDVIGVDLSQAQIALARELVPQAQFSCEDMTEVAFPDDSFDAICSYYAIIHIPREEHAPLLRNFHRMLKPSGLALLCLGNGDLPEDIDEDYRPTANGLPMAERGARMYWSHYDGDVYPSNA